MRSAPLFETPALKALTIQQPWAQLIVTGHKTIENRTWKTEYRGPLYIHAGKRMYDMPTAEIVRLCDLMGKTNILQFGAIIGRVDLVDIVTRSNDPFFCGPYGWVLRNPEILTPVPMRGQMRLIDLPADITQRLASPR